MSWTMIEGWRRWSVAGGLVSVLVAGCSADGSGEPVAQGSETTDAAAGSSGAGGEASSGAEASAAAQLVEQHLRSIEAGDWEAALGDPRRRPVGGGLGDERPPPVTPAGEVVILAAHVLLGLGLVRPEARERR